MGFKKDLRKILNINLNFKTKPTKLYEPLDLTSSAKSKREYVNQK